MIYGSYIVSVGSCEIYLPNVVFLQQYEFFWENIVCKNDKNVIRIDQHTPKRVST